MPRLTRPTTSFTCSVSKARCSTAHRAFPPCSSTSQSTSSSRSIVLPADSSAYTYLPSPPANSSARRSPCSVTRVTSSPSCDCSRIAAASHILPSACSTVYSASTRVTFGWRLRASYTVRSRRSSIPSPELRVADMLFVLFTVEPGKGRKCVILVGRPTAVDQMSWGDLRQAGGVGDTEFWMKLSGSGTILTSTQSVQHVLGISSQDLSTFSCPIAGLASKRLLTSFALVQLARHSTSSLSPIMPMPSQKLCGSASKETLRRCSIVSRARGTNPALQTSSHVRLSHSRATTRPSF